MAKKSFFTTPRTKGKAKKRDVDEVEILEEESDPTGPKDELLADENEVEVGAEVGADNGGTVRLDLLPPPPDPS